MSPHQSIAVGVRLFAIWLAYYALSTTSAAFINHHLDTDAQIVTGGIGLLTIAVALLLWFFPLSIAKKLLSPAAAAPAPSSDQESWLAMGCVLIGLWLLATAIPPTVRDWLYLYSSDFERDHSLQYQQWLTYRGVEILVAVGMIIGNRGLVNIFKWARSAGTAKS